MAFMLLVEYGTTSESAGKLVLECLSRMGEIVHRDHPGVFTYVFRYADETKTRLFFTEIYANEQVFLEHGNDAEFGKLLQQGFDGTTGKSQKELCVREDINSPLSSVTSTILDNYLHVTYIPVENGFFNRDSIVPREVDILIVGYGCDEDAYEQINSLTNCVTCLTFKESDGNRQIIAVINNISNETNSTNDKKPLINTVEIICVDKEAIERLKNMIEQHFEIQTINVQQDFSGYIRHKSLS